MGTPSTTSASHASSGLRKLSVIGILPVFNAKAVKANSTAPAAPNRWPVEPYPIGVKDWKTDNC